MGHSVDSTRENGTAPALTPAVPTMSAHARRASAPYAAKTRRYYRDLSATSVGLEVAIAIILSLFAGRWIDGKLGTDPWLMLVALCFGVAAGMRGVWRYVAEADRAALESERP